METVIEKEIQDVSVQKIIDVIVAEHHDYFKYNVPTISTILNSTMRFDKKAVKHLDLIYKYFKEFEELLERHTEKEKYILFPVLQKLKAEGKSVFNAAELKKTYYIFWREINKLSSLLKQINQLTNNYMPPDNASQSLKQCFWDLKMLEQNCKRYFIIEKKHLLPTLITKENN